MDLILPILFGLIVGISLGLTGGGGSILAVPLLVYGLGMELRSAVAVSLAVVGLVSLAGALFQARYGHVLWRAGAILGGGGILIAPLGAHLGRLLSEQVNLILFSILMIFIAVRMWRGGGASEIPLTRFSCPRDATGRPEFSLSCAGKLVAGGALTGLFSGMFGVGGGFLIAPTLIIVIAAPIEQVMATSLVAIFLISASGFTANIGTAAEFPVQQAGTFLGGGLAGVWGGSAWKSKLSRQVLARGFAAVAITVALYILGRSIAG